MNILKILQKRRDEEFIASSDFWGPRRPQTTRFDNTPPELPSLRETVPTTVSERSHIDEVTEVAVGRETPLPEPKTVAAVVGFTRRKLDPDAVHSRLVAITQPQSAGCEQYRKLRAHFLQTAKARKIKTAVIASYGSGEGKSVTALNLSWLLAQVSGMRVLIVDADPRTSRLSEFLALETIDGFSDVLAGESIFDSTVIELLPSGLCFLPSGAARTDFAELISGEAFTDFVTEASKHFDLIIFDVPPVGLFSETSVLVGRADGVVAVACANKTSCKDIGELAELLPRNKIIAAVLNQVEEKSADGYGAYTSLKI